MDKKITFNPGLRLSVIDSLILTGSCAGVIGLIPVAAEIAFVIGYTVGHFFLFCNVFRVSRIPELIWASLFIFLTGLTLMTEKPGWAWVVFLTLVMTIIIIFLEMKKKSYHGIFWKSVNPNLEQWWVEHRVTLC